MPACVVRFSRMTALLVLQVGCNCNGDGAAVDSDTGTSGDSGTSAGSGSSSSATASATQGSASASASGGSSSGATAGTDTAGGENSGQISLRIPVFEMENMPLTANVPRQVAMVFEVPPEIGTFDSAEFDLEATLPELQIMRTDGGGDPAEPTLEFSVKLLAGDQMNTVCSDGMVEGPAVVTGDANFSPVSIEPSTISASDEALAAVNSGTVSVCFETTATADSMVTLSAFFATIGSSIDCEAPLQIAGEWAGTYSCEAYPKPDCADEGGPISLTIIQDNHTAAYLDDSAFYFGAVCDTSFRYFGGGMGYDEDGEFVLTGDGMATKTSHYTSWFSECEGDCTDMLMLQ